MTATSSDPSQWRVATVKEIRTETPTVKTFAFEFASAVAHLAGQHYEIRLTSDDGYQAARLYSAASCARGDNRLELTVAYLQGGEISPYLHESVSVGDQLEIRGPLGRFFVWQPDMLDPVLLVGGGSGVVPLRCILQAHALAKSAAPTQLLYSARSFDEIIYKPELLHIDNAIITLTDSKPDDWAGETGRISERHIEKALHALPSTPIVYICGRTPFVEAIANLLVGMGVSPARIKAERFGGS